jgi:hypothetical protein
MIPTEKTIPKLEPDKLRWIIYGEPGSSKTPLASGFDDPLFLVTEQSTEALTVFSTTIRCWEDYTKIVQELLTTKHKFKTVVIDVVDMLYNYCVDFCNKRLKIEHISDVGFAKGYHSVDNEFDHWLNKLCMSNLGLIFLSHLEEKEIFKGKERIIKVIPHLAKRGRSILEPKATIIALLEWDKVRKENTIRPEYEDKLVLSFKQTAELYVKDRTGQLPDKLVLNTIPTGTKRTEDVVLEYAKQNYQLICSYFKNKQDKKEEPRLQIEASKRSINSSA